VITLQDKQSSAGRGNA